MKIIFLVIFVFVLSEFDVRISENININFSFCKAAYATYKTVPDRLCGSRTAIKCSAPIKNPYDSKFQGACSSHDFCYRFGYATYGYSKSRCDYLFSKEMNNICVNVDWILIASGGLSVPACKAAAKIYYGAVVVGGASSFKKGRKKCRYKGFCPPGKFSTTGNLNNCKCPLNTRKVYTDKITKSTAYCNGLVDCPTGNFYTDGAYQGCRCHGNAAKNYKGPGNIQANCKGSAGIATCPKGKFSTTGKFYNCKCLGNEGKKRWGVGKMFGRCKGASGIATCPKGRFSTLDKFQNCKCAGNTKKTYSVGSVYATCKGRANKATCPSGKFKTTKKWRGCICSGGKKKKYTNIFKSKARCK